MSLPQRVVFVGGGYATLHPYRVLARQRRDVRILDGGIVSIPSLTIRGGNVGLPNGRAYACFAETALLALSGQEGHFSIGIPDVEQVEHVRSLASEHAHLGFTVAATTSFGVPVPAPVRPFAPVAPVAPVAVKVAA